MKHSHHYSNRAGYENGLDITYPAYTSTQFIMEEEYLQAYPKYFGRFIDAYAEEGINITGICYQNEAYTCNYYPNTSWRPPRRPASMPITSYLHTCDASRREGLAGYDEHR